MNIKEIINRIYCDYFMPNRYKEYEQLLKIALNNGYEIIPLIKYYENKDNLNTKTLVLRHDIDTDIKIAKKLFAIEEKLNIKSTYYFRLNTFDEKLINEIKNFGGEVSYHFEEIATYAFQNNLKTKKEIDNNIEKIQELFAFNLQIVRGKYNINCETIASHGDFVNRYLKITNNYLLTDDIRSKLNIKMEAYDDILLEKAKYCADAVPPKRWSHNNPIVMMETKEPLIVILIHPRQWASNFFGRLKEDFKRYKQGRQYFK